MKLFTDEQYQQLLENGLPENTTQDHPPVVKLVLPGTDCVWLLSEIDPDNKDIAFGLCDLGMGFPELGYVSLNELREVTTPVLGFAVQRAAFFEAKYPMSVYADAARLKEAVTEDERLLYQCHFKQQQKKQNKLKP